jgi:hypothetical protein
MPCLKPGFIVKTKDLFCYRGIALQMMTNGRFLLRLPIAFGM